MDRVNGIIDGVALFRQQVCSKSSAACEEGAMTVFVNGYWPRSWQHAYRLSRLGRMFCCRDSHATAHG